MIVCSLCKQAHDCEIDGLFCFWADFPRPFTTSIPNNCSSRWYKSRSSRNSQFAERRWSAHVGQSGMLQSSKRVTKENSNGH